jgi:hypothetical protein
VNVLEKLTSGIVQGPIQVCAYARVQSHTTCRLQLSWASPLGRRQLFCRLEFFCRLENSFKKPSDPFLTMPFISESSSSNPFVQDILEPILRSSGYSASSLRRIKLACLQIHTLFLGTLKNTVFIHTSTLALHLYLVKYRYICIVELAPGVSLAVFLCTTGCLASITETTKYVVNF